VPPQTLDEDSLLLAVEALSRIDPALARIADRHGPPPLWAREPGFPTLVRIILEQQVSLSSADAAYGRLERAVGAVAPSSVAQAGEPRLAAAGLTRQKSRYLVALARSVADGEFDPAALAALDDDAVRAALTARLGIGRWSADIYLLMALGRPDVWPTGDIALAAAAQHAAGLPARPSFEELGRLAETWRPWRAVAARLLWHAYLSGDRPPRTQSSGRPVRRSGNTR
jgi:DNA-3-methyladenine glycosylase II